MTHPHRGALFENWVIMELIKAQCNAGRRPLVQFLRDEQGHEIDAVIESGSGELLGIEMKSGVTVGSDSFAGLDYWREHLAPMTVHPWLVQGGEVRQRRERGHVVPWNDLGPLLADVVVVR